MQETRCYKRSQLSEIIFSHLPISIESSDTFMLWVYRYSPAALISEMQLTISLFSFILDRMDLVA